MFFATPLSKIGLFCAKSPGMIGLFCSTSTSFKGSVSSVSLVKINPSFFFSSSISEVIISALVTLLLALFTLVIKDSSLVVGEITVTFSTFLIKNYNIESKGTNKILVLLTCVLLYIYVYIYV